MRFDDYLRHQRDMARMIEQYAAGQPASLVAEISKITGGGDRYGSDSLLGRAIGDRASSLDSVAQYFGAALPSSMSSVTAMIEKQRSSYDNILRLAERNVNAFGTSELFRKLGSDARDQIGYIYTGSRLRDEILSRIDGIHASAKSFHQPTSFAAVTTAMTSWDTIISRISSSPSDVLRSAFANPLAETARFIESSARLFARVEDPRVLSTIEQSLLLADAQLNASAEALDDFAFDTDDEEYVEVVQRRLWVPRIQRRELHEAGIGLHEDIELDDLLVLTPVGRAVLVAREITATLHELLEMQKGGVQILKLTTRFSLACTELHFDVPTNRKSFVAFVDTLYSLLYESAGAGGALRYLKEHGGPFTRDECDVVFVVKLLRNHYLHDPEHGSESDIRRKLRDFRELLASRGLRHLQAPSDYRTLHRVLLDETLAFLRKLTTALRGTSQAP
jgi:hypothetical protein